jgi:hypothetical protein
MPWSRYVLGYHGCDEVVARKIAAGADTLAPSKNDYDWLGHGQYFWEDSPSRALHWAEDESKRPGGKIKTPSVLGAVIDLGNCLNLIDAESLALVRSAHARLEKLAQELGLPMAVNGGHDFRARCLDCAVLEALHRWQEEDAFEPFDTVRAFFVEGEPLYPTAGIRQLDHVQICVRNPESIKGYFLPIRA